jgi:hypothetical protein
MKRMGHKMIDETDDQALSKPPYNAPVDERRFMADDKHHWDSVYPEPIAPDVAEENPILLENTHDYPYTVEMTEQQWEEYVDWINGVVKEPLGGWETVKMDVYEDGKYQYTSGNDPVSHPSHYTTGKIEVKDYIADKNFNFFLGNVIKYVSRAGLKGDAVTDLLKARQYIDFEIERLSDN